MSHKLRRILKEQIVENKTPAAKQLRNDKKTQFHVNKYSYPPHFSKDEGDMVT